LCLQKCSNWDQTLAIDHWCHATGNLQASSQVTITYSENLHSQ
jgi:hypothetical protein